MPQIRKIETFVVRHQLSESFYFSQWVYDEREVCLVRVTTDDGTYGWGEGYGPAKVIQAGIQFLSPLLENQNPIGQESLWQKMHLRSLDYGRRGVLVAALSALDVALWDLKGKLLGQPVSMLLGGRKREEVEAYASGLYFSEGSGLPERLAEEALCHRDDGFSAIKMKVGMGIERDVRNVEAVRKALGPEVDLMVDANHAYSLTEAEQLARSLEDFDITWFEEPVSPEHTDGYRSLRQATSIPIAGGECEYFRSGFLHLFSNHCVDIAQPDICAAGGLTEVKKICGMAQTFGVQVVPHTWGTGIAVCAALHLMSNWDVTPGRLHEPVARIELDRTENFLRDRLVQPDIEVNDGIVKVPDAPGLGVDVVEAELGNYLIPQDGKSYSIA